MNDYEFQAYRYGAPWPARRPRPGPPPPPPRGGERPDPQKKPAPPLAAQLAWFTDIGVTRFDLAVRRHSGTWVHLHQDLSLGRLQGLLGWCRHENAHGSDIYLRAHRRQAWPVVFLDDVPLDVADSLVNAHPALAIETSPGSCHIWLRTNHALSESERREVQRAFIAHHSTSFLAADPRSTSGEHYGRAAGFRNRKSGRDCWVNLRRSSAHGLPLDVRPKEGPAPMAKAAADPGRTQVLFFAPSLTSHSQETDEGASPISLAQSDGAIRRKQPDRDRSPSGREWGLVVRALEGGKDPEKVRSALAEIARHRRGRDAERYAELTVRNALRHLATRGADARRDRP